MPIGFEALKQRINLFPIYVDETFAQARNGPLDEPITYMI
jgi:hypothetical protein